MPDSKSKKWLLSLSFLLFIGFIFYSYLVSKELFVQWDFDMTVKFQDKISRRLDYPFSTLSVFGSAEITGAIWLVLTGYLLIRRFWLAFFSMALLPISLALELFGKIFVHHPAPPYLFYRGVIDFNFPSNFVHTDYSYPSGHMTRTAFLVVFFIGYLQKRGNKYLKLIFIPTLSILIGTMAVSRIYLGEHWSTDVIGGLLMGCAAGIASGAMIPLKKLNPGNSISL